MSTTQKIAKFSEEGRATCFLLRRCWIGPLSAWLQCILQYLIPNTSNNRVHLSLHWVHHQSIQLIDRGEAPWLL